MRRKERMTEYFVMWLVGASGGFIVGLFVVERLCS
jgi:hypothetical protein